MAEPGAVDLHSIGSVNVKIDQSCGRMSGFESDADFLDHDGVGIKPKDDVGAEQIAGFTFDDRIHEMGRKLIQHPAIKSRHSRKHLFRPGDIQRQEQRRRMLAAQCLSKCILATVPGGQIAGSLPDLNRSAASVVLHAVGYL